MSLRIPPWKRHFVKTAEKAKEKTEKLEIIVHSYNWEKINKISKTFSSNKPRICRYTAEEINIVVE